MAFSSNSRKSNALSSSAFASSSTSAFSSPPIHYHYYFRKSPNPAASPPSQSVIRFGLDSNVSPSRSISAVSSKPSGKRTCMCSPTTHPGSFRCSQHKNNNSSQRGLNARMRNSLVTVEGDSAKRALAATIRPSSHHQRRRTAFLLARPTSRLSVMSTADDDVI